jgi:hypothetical protein
MLMTKLSGVFFFFRLFEGVMRKLGYLALKQDTSNAYDKVEWGVFWRES